MPANMSLQERQFRQAYEAYLIAYMADQQPSREEIEALADGLDGHDQIAREIEQKVGYPTTKTAKAN